MAKNNVSIKVSANTKAAQQNISQAANSVSKMGNKAKAAEKEVKALNKNVKDLTGGLSSLKGGLSSLNFSSISSGLSSITSNTQALLPNLGKLASTLINPYVLAGTAIVGAGKALFDYNVELDKTLQRTEQLTGLSGNALLNLRNGIKAVADTYGKDFNSTLGTVDTLMSQFGISGEEALDIIKKGFKGGCDDAGKFQDLISKYSGSFNDAGISAKELVAIIGNTRSGIFSEEGMELLQKGAVNIREWSKSLQDSLKQIGIDADQMYEQLQSGEITTVQAIQQISNQLKGLSPQSQEVGDVLKQVFGKVGKTAGMELVTALADVETNLDVVKNQTGEWGDAMDNLANSQKAFEDALSSLFGTSSKGFSTMTTQLKADVYGAVAKIINGFIDWYNNSLIVRAAIQKVALEFKVAWDIIKMILNLFFDRLKTLADLIEGVLTLDWEKVKTSWKKGIESTVKTIADGFQNIADDCVDAVNNTLNGKIQKIEVPVETSVSNKSNNRINTNSNSNTNDETTTFNNKIKKEVKLVPEEGSIKDLETRLSKLNEELTNTNVSDARLNEIIKEKSEIENQIKTLKERNNLIDKKIDLKVVPVEGSIQDIQNKISKLETQIKTGVYLEGYDLEKCQSELKDWKTKLEQEEIRVGVKIDTDKNVSIKLPKVDSNKVIEAGSNEDKMKSLQNANQIAQNAQQMVFEGVISPDEGKKIIDDLNSQLAELGLQPINLVLNTKEAEENLQRTQQNMSDFKDAAGSVGNVFSSLGNAIGGSTGEMMNFAATAISGIAEIIPQIVTMIAASQAQAIASGTAMAAGSMPFPGNLAAIASIVATIAGVFASLPTFESGGIIQGSTTMGDYNLARVNGGEMILNNRQQGNLFSLLNGGSGLSNNTEKSEVKFRISGTNLTGVQKNHKRKFGKIQG